MSEVIEGFKLQKRLRQEERRAKKQANTQRLIDEGIEFWSDNDGYHIVIGLDKNRIDFYPSTGRWFTGLFTSGHGVESLLAYIKSKSN